MLNNTKLRHFWAQIVSWAPRHARKTFIVLAPGLESVYSKLPIIGLTQGFNFNAGHSLAIWGLLTLIITTVDDLPWTHLINVSGLFSIIRFAFHRGVRMPKRVYLLGRKRCLPLSAFGRDWLKCRRRNTGTKDSEWRSGYWRGQLVFDACSSRKRVSANKTHGAILMLFYNAMNTFTYRNLTYK